MTQGGQSKTHSQAANQDQKDLISHLNNSVNDQNLNQNSIIEGDQLAENSFNTNIDDLNSSVIQNRKIRTKSYFGIDVPQVMGSTREMPVDGQKKGKKNS